jgi:hypothetical protein
MAYLQEPTQPAPPSDAPESPIANLLLADLRRLGDARRRYAVALAHRHIRGAYLFERMTETIHEQRTYTRRSCDATLLLPTLTDTFVDDEIDEVTPALADARIILPLMSLTRGSSIADLATSDSKACRLAVLPRYLSRAVSFGLLFSPITSTGPTRADDIIGQLDDHETPEHRLFKLLGQDTPTALDTVTSSVVDIAVKYQVKRFEYDRLLEISTYLAKYFFHWIEIDGRPGELTTLSYSYRSPYRPQQRPAKLNTSARRSRRAHGPYFLLETPNATAARSYNLRMEAPEGHFVSQQRFLVQDNPLPDPPELTRRQHLKRAVSPIRPEDTFTPVSEIVSGDHDEDVRIYDGVRGIRGYVHINSLNLDQQRVGNRDVLSSILLSERPPGTAGLASALSAAVLVLLWLTFWAGRSDFANSHTDIAVVALGIPGVVALWLQEVIGGQARAHVTVLTKTLLWLSADASIAAVGYTTWESLHAGASPFKWWAILVCTRWIFASLSLMLGVALGCQLVRLTRDTLDYRNRLKIGIDNTAIMTNS